MRNRLHTLLLILASGCATGGAAGFTTPETATEQLVAALRANDVGRLEAMFGPDGKDVLHSGDDVADHNGRTKFLAAYDEQHRLEKAADGSYVLCVGKLDWPVPVPIVKAGDTWHWDAAAGREELLDRRIGRNELDAIQVCLAICDAQREYAARDRDEDGILEYADRFASTEGKRDGLFWPTAEGEDESPLGELAAQAAAEGYTKREAGEGPRPYRGYYYRILTAQGEHAAGGAYEYLVGDSLIGGFAIVAYPAEYGVSGIMTFTMNHDGKVFQKDLGEETAEAAKALTLFDPDETWSPAQ